jgi:putative membrane protein
MLSTLANDAGRTTLTGAIKAIERRSSAEVVITVRAKSGFYVHADLIVGCLAALLVLAFLLFSRFEFGIAWFLIDPLLGGAAAGWLSSRSPRLRRLLTPAHLRHRWVETAAHAAFFARGIHLTSGRTGILIYISLLEETAAVIGDRGVVTALPRERWHAVSARIAERVKTGDATRLATEIIGLGDLLAPYLPVSKDDINELPDEVYQ